MMIHTLGSERLDAASVDLHAALKAITDPSLTGVLAFPLLLMFESDTVKDFFFFYVVLEVYVDT